MKWSAYRFVYESLKRKEIILLLIVKRILKPKRKVAVVDSCRKVEKGVLFSYHCGLIFHCKRDDDVFVFLKVNHSARTVISQMGLINNVKLPWDRYQNDVIVYDELGRDEDIHDSELNGIFLFQHKFVQNSHLKNYILLNDCKNAVSDCHKMKDGHKNRAVIDLVNDTLVSSHGELRFVKRENTLCADKLLFSCMYKGERKNFWDEYKFLRRFYSTDTKNIFYEKMDMKIKIPDIDLMNGAGSLANAEPCTCGRLAWASLYTQRGVLSQRERMFETERTQMPVNSYVNFDYERDASNLFKRMVATLSKIAQGTQASVPNFVAASQNASVKGSSFQVATLSKIAQGTQASVPNFVSASQNASVKGSSFQVLNMSGSKVAHVALKGPSVVKEIFIGLGLGLAAGTLWKMHHWNEQRKVRSFYDMLEKGQISVVVEE